MVISWFHLEILHDDLSTLFSSGSKKNWLIPCHDFYVKLNIYLFQPAKSDRIWLDCWSTNHWWHVLNSVHIFYTLQIVQSLLSKCSFNKTIFVRLVTISMYSLTCRKCRVRGILRYMLVLSGGEQSIYYFFLSGIVGSL